MVLPPETGWVPGEKFKFILSTGPLLPGYRGVICVSSIGEKRLKAKEYDQVRDSSEIFFFRRTNV